MKVIYIFQVIVFVVVSVCAFSCLIPKVKSFHVKLLILKAR